MKRLLYLYPITLLVVACMVLMHDWTTRIIVGTIITTLWLMVNFIIKQKDET